MNLRFVEAFYWVASLKSVTRAADKLFLTQSAMSSRIAALEEELGVLLLDRRDKQFRLTVAGQRFLTYAQRLLELQREVKAEMGSGTPQAIVMRIGAIESVLHSWLIPWIEKLRTEHPALELELTVETTPILMEQVRRHRLASCRQCPFRVNCHRASALAIGASQQRQRRAGQPAHTITPATTTESSWKYSAIESDGIIVERSAQ